MINQLSRTRSLRRRVGAVVGSIVGLSALVAFPATSAVALDPEVELHQGPIFEGQLPLLFPGLGIAVAGDPSIIQDGANSYRMYYGCYGINNGGTETCLATSSDGLNWTDANIGSQATYDKGQVLFGQPGVTWDGAHETPFAVQHGDQTRLYFAGYADPSLGFFGNTAVPVGLATSSNGLDFKVKAHSNPVLNPTPNSLDDHGMTSPSVTKVGPTWYMTYSGWCFESETVCPRLASDRYTATLAATSSNGTSWTKSSYGNLIPDSDLPSWAPNGIAETHVFRIGTSNDWVMLFTGLDQTGPAGIGVATRTGANPVGPWTVRSTPLITNADLTAADGWPATAEAPGTKPAAPHGVVTNGTLRIWFAGESSLGFRIGYAEASWPLS